MWNVNSATNEQAERIAARFPLPTRKHLTSWFRLKASSFDIADGEEMWLTIPINMTDELMVHGRLMRGRLKKTPITIESLLREEAFYIVCMEYRRKVSNARYDIHGTPKVIEEWCKELQKIMCEQYLSWYKGAQI